jgi:hypothetical protein
LLYLFNIDHAQPSWPVNIWVTNMLVLFRPQIKSLIHARDRVVSQWQQAHPDENVYEDRALELTTEMAVDADAQLIAVAQALAGRNQD